MLQVNESFNTFLLGCKQFCTPCCEATCKRLVHPATAKAADVDAILERLKGIDAEIEEMKKAARNGGKQC